MIGYGAAKAATMHIGKSLAASNSGMPKDSSVVTIAPYVFLFAFSMNQIGLQVRRKKRATIFVTVE